jgi:outer membrane protein
MSPAALIRRSLVGGILAVLLVVTAPGPRLLLASEDPAPETGAAPPPPTPEPGLALQGPGDTSPLPLKSAETSGVLQKARSRGYLTLGDCFAIAVRENERIGRAQEDATQAGLVKMLARGAILPLLTLEDNYYRQEKIPPPPGSEGTATAFSFADMRNQTFVHLKQPLFSGLREMNFLKYADANIRTFEYALEDARRLLYASVAQAFYVVLQIEGEVRTLEDTVKVEGERLKEIQARREAGLARKSEVLLMESQLARDESRLTSTRNDLQVSRERLTFQMTVPADLPLRDVPFASQGGTTSPRTGDGSDELAGLIRNARANRSDLKQRESAVQAAEYQVAVARGAYLPSVSLDAYGYVDRTNYSQFQQETNWSAQIDFTFPVFDGGRIKSTLLTAKSRLQQAILDRDQLARQVDLEVEAAYLTLQSDISQMKTLEVSVASADENYNLVKEEYRHGLSTNLEVFAAQNQLLSARLDLERQKYQVGLDAVALSLFQGVLPMEPGGLPSAVPAPVTPGDAPPTPAVPDEVSPAPAAPSGSPVPSAPAAPPASAAVPPPPVASLP